MVQKADLLFLSQFGSLAQNLQFDLVALRVPAMASFTKSSNSFFSKRSRSKLKVVSPFFMRKFRSVFTRASITNFVNVAFLF